MLMLLLVIGILAMVAAGPGLCHNLAAAWGTKPSPPFNPLLTFSSPMNDDMLFDAGEGIRIMAQAGARSLGLRWELARNCVVRPFRNGTGEAMPGNRYAITIATAGLLPGFYELRCAIDDGTGTGVPGVCVFGWRVADIPRPVPRPERFRAFWDAGLAAVRAVPLAPQAGPLQVFDRAGIEAYNLASACLPADFDPAGHRCASVESGKVSYAGIGGVRIHAWLAKPPGPGPFPALLVLPGAGVGARPRPLEHARHGYLAIDIQVHGHDVDLPAYPQVPGYFDGPVWEPAEDMYYRRIYLNAARAVDYLLSRPDVDPQRIAVVGGSQGGRLSLVVAALDARICAGVVAIIHYGNQPYLRWAAACTGDGMDLTTAPAPADTPEGRGTALLDPANFAPDVRCPMLLNAGLIDPVSPAASVWGVFQNLGAADRTMVVQPGMGHDWSAAFDRQALRWLEPMLRP